MARKTLFNQRGRNENALFVFSGEPDRNLLAIMAGLIVFGAIMIYSASFIAHSDTFHFFVRHMIFLIMGGTLAFGAYIFNYKHLPKIIVPGLIFSIFLLIIVLIPGVGREVQGASRWIDLKFFDLQPSEVAKLVFIVYLAAWSSKQQDRIGFDSENIKAHIQHELLPFLMIMGTICTLVLLQPNLSTTGIIGMASLIVYFLSGRDSIHTLGTGFILFILVISGLAAAIIAPYRVVRVQTFLDFMITGEVPDPEGKGFQLKQVLTAVGSGGFSGVGFGDSRQKFHYLGQTSFTDNIFAVIGEEFGFIGTAGLTCAYFYFLLRGMYVASRIPDRFGQLLCSGIVVWVTLQAFIHIGTNIGMIPITGMPLPYMSYGGSSTVSILVGSGILLNVSRYANLK